MKTKTDFTIQLFYICFGLVFVIPIIYSKQSLIEGGGLLSTILCTSFIFLALFKTESIEITKSTIIKRKFMGLIKTEYPLNSIISLKKKKINIDHYKNPLIILKLFINADKYLKFNVITLNFTNNSRMELDERTMSKKELEKITVNLRKNIKLNKKTVANNI